MADRTVKVVLTAETNAFQRAMASASASARAVGQEIKGSLDNATGRDWTRVGGELTRNVTLPLVGVGAAAGAMAMQFDDAFRQMQGLAGVTADEVDGLKDSVLELAGDTAQSPQRLAEALYFVRSAGIDGAAAMETLEVAAKGATAGLGDAQTVADAVTSALGAYGEANITAARAGDVLVAAAREGKAEASALAPQFGRLLPIASELGVTFDEVGAGLAFLSRSGGGAELAATNLGNVLQKLLTPADEGQRALEAMGMSTDTLRESIAQRGLLDTLVFLRSSLEANGMELGDFSRDAQFTTGVLALTRNEGENAREVFDALANSSGALGEAFEAAAQGPGFEMRQSIAEIQALAIQLGDTLLPIATNILGVVSTMAQAFADLPGPVQAFVGGLAGIAAVAGPISTVVGKFKELQEKLTKLGPMGAEAASALGPLAAGVGIAAIAWVGYSARQAEAKARADEFTDAILSQTGALEDNINAVFARRIADSDIIQGAVDAGVAIEDLVDIAKLSGDELATAGDAWAGSFSNLGNAEAQVDRVSEALERAGLAGTPVGEMLMDLAASGEYSYGELQELLNTLGLLNNDFERGSAAADDQAAAMDAVGLAADGTAPSIDGVSGALDSQTRSAADAEKALEDYLDTLRGAIDPLFGMLTAFDDNRQALADLDEALAANSDAIDDNNVSAEELNRLHQRAAESALDVEEAAVRLSDAMRNGSVSTDGARAMLQNWVTQGLITQDTADTLAARIGLAAAAADGFAGDYTANMYVNSAAAEARLASLQGRMQALANSGTRVAVPSGGFYQPAGGGFAGTSRPGPTDTIPTMLSPGEFVVSAPAARAAGAPFLHALNDGNLTALSGAVGGSGGGETSGSSVLMPVTINLYGGATQTDADMVVDALFAAQRRNGIQSMPWGRAA